MEAVLINYISSSFGGPSLLNALRQRLQLKFLVVDADQQAGEMKKAHPGFWTVAVHSPNAEMLTPDNLKNWSQRDICVIGVSGLNGNRGTDVIIMELVRWLWQLGHEVSVCTNDKDILGWYDFLFMYRKKLGSGWISQFSVGAKLNSRGTSLTVTRSSSDPLDLSGLYGWRKALSREEGKQTGPPQGLLGGAGDRDWETNRELGDPT